MKVNVNKAPVRQCKASQLQDHDVVSWGALGAWYLVATTNCHKLLVGLHNMEVLNLYDLRDVLFTVATAAEINIEV